jgi:hypothetical protein
LILEGIDNMVSDNHFSYRVGFLGAPNSFNPFNFHLKVAWDQEAVGRLKALGFNTIQINVAWGPRPDDEPLNLEDIIELTPEELAQYPQPVPLHCDPSPVRRAARRKDMHDRIALCRKVGLRTLFHFGAPYNAHMAYGDNPPNCIMDEKVIQRYELMLETFVREFPGVDDILIYTYDQDAWLCNEFGECPRCQGVPLHERLAPFLERLAGKWQQLNPGGRMWWEPWELSAGQVLKNVEVINPQGFGLMVHCNIAEVQSTMPVDRWLKNTAALAQQRGIPVVVEYFLGGSSEEMEPFLCLSHPLVILRGLRAIHAAEGVTGIKEYYGLVPIREDPNLRMTALFFANPQISDEQALKILAEPYGEAAAGMVDFWRLTSAGQELFPWDVSWFAREVGRSRVDHSLAAAMLRGQQCHTPSWVSSRHAIFMKCDDLQPDAWMLEDIQLRCQMAADRWDQALKLGQALEAVVPAALLPDFHKNLIDLAGLYRRAMAYSYHLRETNLAEILRKRMEQGLTLPPKIVAELGRMLAADLENCRAESSLSRGEGQDWPEMLPALALFREDLTLFLKTYFIEVPDLRSKGVFSVTSR